VMVADQLRVNVIGSGSLTYYGNPTVDQNITGSGKVIKK
jgi:hypothetical protein